MNFNNYLQTSSNIFAENRLLKFVVVVLAISTVICMLLANRAMNYHRTIILPPTLDQKIVITGNTMSNEALKMYMRYTTALFLNFTPDTIKSNFAELLELVGPETYEKFKSQLLSIADKAKTVSATSSFYPSKIQIDEKKQQIEITGLRKFFSSTEVLEEKIKTYVITYKITNGRFYIHEFVEKI